MPGAPQAPGSQALAAAALAIARRFANGATLWCAAPEWPWHAQHVAVEFVHPVIMGKRALPAAALTDPGVVGELRRASRTGDVLLAIGTPGNPPLAEAVRLARVWGLLTVWLRAGELGAPVAAEHVLWRPEPLEVAAFGGGFVLSYHLLWELTHVCFEHPGLLRSDGGDDEVCITCADEGRLAEVLEMTGPATARVRSSNGFEAVDVSLVEPPEPGDIVVVHAGTAISHMTGSRK